jgi:hypothetical protein
VVDWLPWALLAAAILHILEEFVLPGEFSAWYRRYRSDASRITPRFLVIVNAALLVACLNVALLGRNPIGVAYWLTMAALMCSNGCWHVWASFKSRSYSPGVVTGLAVYVPLAAYGYRQFLRNGEASIPTAALAFLIGGSYHLWSAAYHGALGKKSQ